MKRKLDASVAAAALVLGTVVVATTGTAALAAGTTYWVDGADAACTDLGSGTEATPFCSISAGTKKAVVPGDTVHVAPAVYREQVNLAASGTPDLPITVTADQPGVVVLGTRSLATATAWTATGTSAWSTPYAPPSRPRQVLLDGARLTQAPSASGTTTNSWFYDSTGKVLYVDIGGANPGDGHQVEAGAQSFGVNVSGRHDVVVSNLTTRDQNFAGVRLLSSSAVTVSGVTATGSASNGVLVDGTTASTVDGVEVSGSLSTGIRLSGSSTVTIAGSRSHDNGFHGIGLTTSPDNVIDGNTTYANASTSGTGTANGIDVNTSSSGNTVVDNTSYGNQDSGIQVYNGSHDVLVARNVSTGNGDHGFDTLASTGATYLNNTAYGNRRDGISVEGNSTGATLANNILVDNGEQTNEYDLYVDPGSVAGFSADYDVAYNPNTTPTVKFNGVVYRTILGFTAATGMEAHGLAVDPDFADPGSRDLRLTAGSAAVDAADASVPGFRAKDATGAPPVDDPLVPDTGSGSPTYADRGALEFAPTGTPDDYAPHAALFLNPPSAQVPPSTTVLADASGSNDADLHGIETYSFDFGDGTTVGPQTDATASHRYAATGTFRVTVTVTDKAGLQDTASAQEQITDRPLQTYYVEQTSTSCSDAGAGSQSQPTCSIGAALKKALAGDTVLVGPGQYREQVQPTATGEQGAPITVRGSGAGTVVLGSNDVSDAGGWSSTTTTAWRHAYPTAPTQVWLDGQRLAPAAGALQTTTDTWFYDSTAAQLYVDTGGGNPALGHTVGAGARNFGLLLRDVVSYDVSGIAVRETQLSGVYLDRADHVTMTDVDVAATGAHGFTVDSSTQVRLAHVTAVDSGSIGVRFFNSSDSSLRSSTTHDNAFHGVSVQGSQRVTVDAVTSYANVKPGTRVACGIDVSSSSADVVVDNSTTYGNDDSGIEAYTGATGTVMRRNLSYDNGDHGIDSSGAPGSVVVSNTVVGNATAGINFEGGSSGATTRDNIVVDNAVASPRTVGDIRVDESSAAGSSLDRDLVFQSAGGVLFEWASQPYSTVAGFQSASGQEGSGLTGDPAFVDLTGRDLRLSAQSPAIDAAFTQLAAWLAADHDGAPPVDDPAVVDSGNGSDPFADLGALEYGGPVAVGTVAPDTGTAPLTVTVDGSASVGLTGPITAYEWACGQGTTLTGATGTCTYPVEGSYTARLTVRDGTGLSDTVAKTVTVGADLAPTVALAATPSQGYVPLQVVLDAGGSSDTDGTPIAGYAFDCGNGTTSGSQASATFSCSYTSAGNFTASVEVTDTAGLLAGRTVPVKVLADVAPTATLTATPSQAYVPQDVALDGSGSTDPDATPIASYTFNCGNGTGSGSQPSPTFTCTYPKAGGFTASVTVRDTAGRSSTAKVPVKILADVAPTAVLSLSSTKVPVGGSITADGSGSSDNDKTPIATYRFDCGNGVTTGEQVSPTTTCTYPKANSYTVKMWVTDSIGKVSSSSVKIRVS